MMHKHVLILTALLFVLSFSFSSYAKEESWYLLGGLGPVINTSTPGKMNPKLELSSNSGLVTIPVSFPKLWGSFGLYLPFFSKMFLTGFNLSFLSTNQNDQKVITTNQYSLSNLLFFFATEPGGGFFLRNDTGYVNLKIANKDEQTGVGTFLGIGKGIILSDESRLLVGLYINFQKVDDGFLKTGLLGFDILW